MTRRAAQCYLAAVAIAIGGYVHLVLYRRSYHAIPHIGALFAFDIIVAAGITMALLTRHDTPSILGALAHTASAVAGFALSRTVGLWGFKESGFTPSPHAAIALAAEIVAFVVLVWATVGQVAGSRAQVGARSEMLNPSNPKRNERDQS
jgi:hypothetical protein